MPIWMQSMRTPVDSNGNNMTFNWIPENFASFQPMTRRPSIGEPVNQSPLFGAPPPLMRRPSSSCSSSSNSSDTTIVPPIHNKNYQESRYKTELCRHFEENGMCPHGQQCLFAHGIQELRPFRGRHRKFKTQLCKAFHSDGFCSFGPRCSYIHTGADIIPAVVQRLGSQALANSQELAAELKLRFKVLGSPEKRSEPKTRSETVSAPALPKDTQTVDRLAVFSNFFGHDFGR